MQGLLLRFLETGEIQKVGADRAVGRVNVRVIAATNRNLRDMIVEGTFREDLFYRLNVIHLTVPPLRERREDIPLLIDYFLERFTQNNGIVRAPDLARRDQLLSAVLVARQRARARERHRAARRDRPQRCRRLEDLPMEVRVHHGVGVRPKRERRRTVADDLYKKLVEDRESFWTAVYPLYMQREITRGNVRDLVRKGLEEARGNYKIVARLFNMEARDYKRFLNFLRKHDCQLAVQRVSLGRRSDSDHHMYEAFFGLKERPFELVPNPRFLFLTPRQREALSNLQYGLTTARGLTLLIGEAGTGKTTLVQAALSDPSTATACVWC